MSEISGSGGWSCGPDQGSGRVYGGKRSCSKADKKVSSSGHKPSPKQVSPKFRDNFQSILHLRGQPNVKDGNDKGNKSSLHGRRK